ncbi:MAG: response regulator [Sphingomonadales bacterium]|nr:MAG: response regulator [Sphingomonadales bacterium]
MPRGCILVIDDDHAVRESTARLLHRADYTTQTFESGDEFLAAALPDDIGCILLDVRMPGTDGLGVLRILEARGEMPPVVVITGHGDIPLAVERCGWERQISWKSRMRPTGCSRRSRKRERRGSAGARRASPIPPHKPCLSGCHGASAKCLPASCADTPTRLSHSNSV